MSENNLKPCPFCGEKEELYIENRPCFNSYGKWYVAGVCCWRCNITLWTHFDKDTIEEAEADAVKAWNTRDGKTEE